MREVKLTAGTVDDARCRPPCSPGGRLIQVPDSHTLMPEDQPGPTVMHIRAFVAGA